MLAHLGPHAKSYAVDAMVAAYLAPINKRLSEELVLDEDNQVITDGWVDGDVRELLDDALYVIDLQAIAEANHLDNP